MGGERAVPNCRNGFRWGEKGKWNIGLRDGAAVTEIKLRLSLLEGRDDTVPVQFPYFGGRKRDHFKSSEHADVLSRNVPVRKLQLAEGEALVTTVFDLLAAPYDVDRGLGAPVAAPYDDDAPYTPAWPRPEGGRVGQEW